METVLLAVVKELRCLLDQGEAEVIILLDHSAAFNTVDHHTLIQRVLRAGVEARALEWLTSFLEKSFLPDLGSVLLFSHFSSELWGSSGLLHEPHFV